MSIVDNTNEHVFFGIRVIWNLSRNLDGQLLSSCWEFSSENKWGEFGHTRINLTEVDEHLLCLCLSRRVAEQGFNSDLLTSECDIRPDHVIDLEADRHVTAVGHRHEPAVAGLRDGGPNGGVPARCKVQHCDELIGGGDVLVQVDLDVLVGTSQRVGTADDLANLTVGGRLVELHFELRVADEPAVFETVEQACGLDGDGACLIVEDLVIERQLGGKHRCIVVDERLVTVAWLIEQVGIFRDVCNMLAGHDIGVSQRHSDVCIEHSLLNLHRADLGQITRGVGHDHELAGVSCHIFDDDSRLSVCGLAERLIAESNGSFGDLEHLRVTIVTGRCGVVDRITECQTECGRVQRERHGLCLTTGEINSLAECCATGTECHLNTGLFDQCIVADGHRNINCLVLEGKRRGLVRDIDCRVGQRRTAVSLDTPTSNEFDCDVAGHRVVDWDCKIGGRDIAH